MKNRGSREIHRTYDAYGPIQVIDDGNKRYMAFGNDDEQSCILKNQPHILQHEYTRATLLALLMVNPNDICVIGLGGGAIVTALHHVLPECHITVVELRKMVLKTAQKYFGIPSSKKLTFIVDDGFNYLKQANSSSSDLIIADMYSENGIDQNQLSNEFAKLAYAHLKDGGWLVMNCWLDHRLEDGFIEVLQSHFSQIYACDTGGGNWVLFAGKVDLQNVLLHEDRLKPLSKLAGYSLMQYFKRLVTLAN